MASDDTATTNSFNQQIDEDRLYDALGRIAVALKMPIDRSDLNLADVATAELEDGKFGMLIAWARQVGIYVKEVKLDVIEFYGALQESFPLIMASGNGSLWIFEGLNGKNFQATHITDRSQTVRIRRGELRKMLAHQIPASSWRNANSNWMLIWVRGIMHSREAGTRTPRRSAASWHYCVWTPATFGRLPCLLRWLVCSPWPRP